MKLLGLVFLLTLSLLMTSSSDAFAGDQEYENRANAYWLQFYVLVVVIVGIMIIVGVAGYKIGKRKAMSKNL